MWRSSYRRGQYTIYIPILYVRIIFVIFDLLTVFLMIWGFTSQFGSGLTDPRVYAWVLRPSPDRGVLRSKEGGETLDLSLYPNAIAMNKEEFMEWSNNALDEIIRASGTKRMMDKMTAPMWSWAQRNSLHPLHFGIACCALEMATTWRAVTMLKD